jgi:uncharacterized protein
VRTALTAGLIGATLGWLFFRYVDARWIKIGLGIEAILFAAQTLRAGSKAWTGTGAAFSPVKASFWSMIAGFTSFISHSGGPPMMQFLVPMKLERRVFVGTLAIFFSIINFAKIVPYAELGLFDRRLLSGSLALLPIVPLGYLVGLQLLKRISQAAFTRAAMILLMMAGIKLLWDAFV